MNSSILPTELLLEIVVHLYRDYDIHTYHDIIEHTYQDQIEKFLKVFDIDQPISYIQLINKRYPMYIHRNLFKYNSKAIYYGLLQVELYHKSKEISLQLNNYKYIHRFIKYDYTRRRMYIDTLYDYILREFIIYKL